MNGNVLDRDRSPASCVNAGGSPATVHPGGICSPDPKVLQTTPAVGVGSRHIGVVRDHVYKCFFLALLNTSYFLKKITYA